MATPQFNLNNYKCQLQKDNNYGTILSDLTKPFTYRLQRYQYEHDNACLQNRKNTNQRNYRDIHLPDAELTDAESELRGITRLFDRTPFSRYKGYCTGKNDKNIPVCTNKETIPTECEKKIITKYYYDGPTKNYNGNKISLQQQISKSCG